MSTSHTRRAVKEGYSVASGRVPPRLHNGDRPDIARWGTYSPFTAGGVGEMANLVPGVRGDQHQPQYDTQVTHAPRVEPSRDRCTAPQLGAAVPGGPRGGWFRLDRVANADSKTCARGNTCDNAGGGVADHQAAAPLPWPAHTTRRSLKWDNGQCSGDTGTSHRQADLTRDDCMVIDPEPTKVDPFRRPRRPTEPQLPSGSSNESDASGPGPPNRTSCALQHAISDAVASVALAQRDDRGDIRSCDDACGDAPQGT